MGETGAVSPGGDGDVCPASCAVHPFGPVASTSLRTAGDAPVGEEFTPQISSAPGPHNGGLPSGSGLHTMNCAGENASSPGLDPSVPSPDAP